ncbi:MAG: histidinol-phosphate transaminase [Desulfobacterales bacterium]|nr:MAG: histidinol-phosphate transaminase [Desulfobacterales bacterium]
MKVPVPDYIRNIAPYAPGKPVEELEREYGIKNAVKLASNENPLGPCPSAMKAVADALPRLHRYPDGASVLLRRALSAHLDYPEEGIVTGNGSDDLIALIATAFLAPGDEAILPHPSFLMYDISVITAGAAPVFVPLKDLRPDLPAMRTAVTDKTRVVYICSPNNPTGTTVTEAEFAAFLADLPRDILVVIDEAYAEFVRDPEALRGRDWIGKGHPVISLRTFSKAYGLAGLRVGYGLMSPEMAGIFHRVRPPFNVNLPGQIGAAAALADTDFLDRTVRLTHEGLDWLYSELERMGLAYFPTQSNFFLIDVGRPAKEVFKALLRKGVIVRAMTAYGYPDYIRVNAGLPEENQRFATALRDVLA